MSQNDASGTVPAGSRPPTTYEVYRYSLVWSASALNKPVLPISGVCVAITTCPHVMVWPFALTLQRRVADLLRFGMLEDERAVAVDAAGERGEVLARMELGLVGDFVTRRMDERHGVEVLGVEAELGGERCLVSETLRVGRRDAAAR